MCMCMNYLGIRFNFFYFNLILGNPDTLICGNCRECFTELSELLDHKKTYCKLRFVCRCQNGSSSSSSSSSNSLCEYYK